MYTCVREGVRWRCLFCFSSNNPRKFICTIKWMGITLICRPPPSLKPFHHPSPTPTHYKHVYVFIWNTSLFAWPNFVENRKYTQKYVQHTQRGKRVSRSHLFPFNVPSKLLNVMTAERKRTHINTHERTKDCA